MTETHERTGATEKQIEAARERLISNGERYRLLPQVRISAYEAEIQIRRIANYLIPPGTVIVLEAVLTAAWRMVNADVGPGWDEQEKRDLAAELAAMGGKG